MTYFQLLNKALTYLIQEPITSEDFVFWEALNEENQEEIQKIKEVAKKEQCYLFLKILNEKDLLNSAYQELFNSLEKELSTTFLSNDTQEQAVSIGQTILNEDAFYQDAKWVLRDSGNYENYSVDQLEKLKAYKEQFEQRVKNEMKLYIEANHEIMQSPMENMVYDVLPILARMYFFKTGSQYIESLDEIPDVDLKERCYEYIQYNISLYAWKKKARYNPRMLRYATKLISLVYSLAVEKRYDAIDNLIEIDDYLIAEDVSYISLLELLYHNEIEKKIQLSELVASSSQVDADFFYLLQDPLLHQQFSNQEIATTLAYYCDHKSASKTSMQDLFGNLMNPKEKQFKKQKDFQKFE